ncbi:MAG: glycosyltransferase family 9 protein [Bacteroidetes bacterium]|nr:glycosyltransferase family 9 protein [Bacteroidota bacterium]
MKKILVVRFSSIGDIVLTTPVIRCIKTQLGAEIHFLTKEQFAGIMHSSPYVDKVISIKNKVSEVNDVLRKENYDFIVDLHTNLRSSQVKKILKKPFASFPKLNIRKWLLVNARIDVLPRVHIVDRYFETVKELAVKNDGKGLDYFIPEKDNIDIHSLPQNFQNGFIAFAVGAKFFTKQLPEEKIISIIEKLKKPVVLLGGKEDEARAEKICDAVGKSVFNACGKYNLNQSASVLKQAELVITHDTGLMHIAAAFKKKIFSVWGNTVPQLGMYPYLPGEGSRIIEVKDLSCRPCSKIGFSKCPKGHFKCMKNIDVNEFSELRTER